MWTTSYIVSFIGRSFQPFFKDNETHSEEVAYTSLTAKLD